MKKVLMFIVLGASAFAAPALAQQADPDPRFPDRAVGGAPDIERQIQRLDDLVNSEDKAGRISPSEADTLVRELRDIETRLLDVRSRTFRGSENWSPPGRTPNTWNSDPRNDPYQGRDDANNGRPDDSRDSSGGAAY